MIRNAGLLTVLLELLLLVALLSPGLFDFNEAGLPFMDHDKVSSTGLQSGFDQLGLHFVGNGKDHGAGLMVLQAVAVLKEANNVALDLCFGLHRGTKVRSLGAVTGFRFCNRL